MEEFKQVSAALKRIEEEIHTIKRGVYGDEPNGVEGLITTDKKQHIRIKALEDRDKKRIWVGAGAIAMIEIIIQVIKLTA